MGAWLRSLLWRDHLAPVASDQFVQYRFQTPVCSSAPGESGDVLLGLARHFSGRYI